MQSGGGVASGPEAAKITFLIKNSRYKTGVKEHQWFPPSRTVRPNAKPEGRVPRTLKTRLPAVPAGDDRSPASRATNHPSRKTQERSRPGEGASYDKCEPRLGPQLRAANEGSPAGAALSASGWDLASDKPGGSSARL